MASPTAPETQTKESLVVIRQLTPNATVISVPFAGPGGAEVGTRATIFRLPTSGAILVFCPADLNDEVRAAIAAMGGNVKYIVAGSAGHHMFMDEWVKAYPEVEVIAQEGLREKRAKMKLGDIPFQYVMTAANKTDPKFLPAEVTQDVDIEYFDGSQTQEIALFHKADKILAIADLFWTFPGHEQYSKAVSRKHKGIFTGAFHTFGWDDKAHSGFRMRLRRWLDWYIMSSKNRESYNKSIEHIDVDWDFQIVVPCHGEVLDKEGEAKRIFECIFKWQLEAAKKKK
jgi:hypothetical protein